MSILEVMRFRLGRYIGILGIGVCLLLAAPLLQAQQGHDASSGAEQVDAVLLIDASGSMRLTDPKQLRNEGARLFVQFLKPGDRLAIVSFAEDAKVVRPFGPVVEGTAAEVQQTLNAVGDGGQYTDILAGVKLAHSLLATTASKATPVIVLLSDGKLEPHPQRGTSAGHSEELLNQVLPELKAEGIRIHTLAFSTEADRQLLEEIALATEGSKAFTPDAESIHSSYASLFLAVKKPQVLPLTKRGFRIDSGIQEATFYVNRQAGGEVTLRPPQGEALTEAKHPADIKWFKGEGFDVITVYNPAPGDWQLTGLVSNDGFATVLTNLKLITEWPGTIQEANRTLLQARLYENEKPVVLPEMSGATKFAFEITPTDKISEPIMREFLVDDGSHGDRVAGDGIFSYSILLKEVGEYRLRVLARAPTFERSQQIPFRVRPPMVAVTLEQAQQDSEHGGTGHEHGAPAKTTEDHASGAADSEHTDPAVEAAHGDEHHDDGAGQSAEAYHNIVVTLSSEAQSFRQIEVTLFAYDKERRKFGIPLDSDGHGRYLAPIHRLPTEGKFEVQAVVTGEGRKKDKVKFETPRLAVERTAAHSGGPEVIVVAEVQEAPSVIPALILAILIQGGAAGGLIFMLRRSLVGPKVELPSFEVPGVAFAALEALEGKAAVTELSLDDPMLIGTDPVPLPDGIEAPSSDSSVEPSVTTTPEDAVAAAPEPPPAPPVEEPSGGEEQPQS